MKFIDREHIDNEKWDRLVDESGGLVFSKSFYLDAVAENWCIYVDDDYSEGIAIPFVVRLGKRSAYTPLFLRCLEWLGGVMTQKQILELRKKFPKGELSIVNLSDEFEKLIFQEIVTGSTPKYNEQTKRMMRKFDNSTLSLIHVDTPNHILQIITDELPSKVTSVNRKSMVLLESLISSLHHNQLLRMVEVRDEGKCVGGAFFIVGADRVVYLKSAFRPHAKKNGCMYRIMDLEIRKALDENRTFDFGGSRVDGVRRFNLNMGGKDQFYSSVKWDKMPLWYKGIKTLNDKLRKK